MLHEQIKEWAQLDPAVRQLWRIEAAIGGVILATVIVTIDLAVSKATGSNPVPGGVVGGLVALSLFLWLQYVAVKKFDFWRYDVGEDELGVAHGIWWQARIYVPRARIQHVDITAGPISRALGLATVTVFVGGQAGAVAVIPGLATEEADQFRRTLMKLDKATPPPVLPPEEVPFV